MSSSRERGPSEGLLARAKEAIKNPHLVWLGLRAPSPRQAAMVCQILGLPNEEEKNAKAVAVLKRDWPVLFEQLFSKVSEAKKQKTKEEKEMEVILGQGHYAKIATEKAQKLAAKIENIFKRLIQEKGLKDLGVARDSGSYKPFIYVFLERIGGRIGGVPVSGAFVVRVKLAISDYPPAADLDLKGVWANLTVEVIRKEYFNLAKKFARVYEKRSNKKVVIEKEY